MLRKFFTLAALCALCALMPRTAKAQTYGSWGYYGDRWWRVMADVRNPRDGSTYVSTNGTTGSVPHDGAYENILQSYATEGMLPHFYTIVGDLRRYDRGGQFWRYFDDQIRGYTQPQNAGATYSRYRITNPWYGSYWDNVYVSPTNTWHLCDATTQAYDHDLGYTSRWVSERIYYKVRPGN